MKWYVLQVMSGHEKKVKKAIEENIESHGMRPLIEKVFLPIENVMEIKHGEQKVSEKRLWPGYIFIMMDLTDESWDFIKKQDGVIDFLGGEKPAPLTDGEVENILKELEGKKKGVVQKHQFEVGDSVKIIDGVFVNFTGTIQEIFHDKGRLSVMVSIFGRDTRVDDLEFWQIEKVTEEN
ncbi:MAG: transcription termination/antitermination protein NusG [Parachlamydiales bacterium]|nr:transcription termination/antitermination protein NusG [Parachlamydiales bacterium]